MASYYKCTDCDDRFETDCANTRSESETSEFWGAVATTTIEFHVCPSCHSDNLEEYYPCEKCADSGELVDTLDGTDDCLKCFIDDDPEEFADYCKRWPGSVPEEFRK